MKSFFRSVGINAFSLYLLTLIFSGVQVHGGMYTLLLSGLVLSILSIVIKPILKLLTLPLNIITFGAFSFLINAILLYILTVIIPQVSITAFVFNGANFLGFVIPRIVFNNTLFAFVAFSIVYSFIVEGVQWIIQ